VGIEGMIGGRNRETWEGKDDYEGERKGREGR